MPMVITTSLFTHIHNMPDTILSMSAISLVLLIFMDSFVPQNSHMIFMLLYLYFIKLLSNLPGRQMASSRVVLYNQGI